MGRRSEYKQTDLPRCYFSQAVVHMHAYERIFGKQRFANFMHLFQRHFFISGIFDSGHLLSVDGIGTQLPQEYAVSANIGFGTVLLNAVRNERGLDGALGKYIFWFAFFHNYPPANGGNKATVLLPVNA